MASSHFGSSTNARSGEQKSRPGHPQETDINSTFVITVESEPRNKKCREGEGYGSNRRHGSRLKFGKQVACFVGQGALPHEACRMLRYLVRLLSTGYRFVLRGFRDIPLVSGKFMFRRSGEPAKVAVRVESWPRIAAW